MQWLETKVVDSYYSGNGHMTMGITVRIKWWLPSFWREVRSMVEVEPRWMTWPIVAWCILTNAHRFNRGPR